MDLTDADLPDDVDALKALVRAHAASAHANAQRVVQLQDQLSSRVIEIEHLKLMLAKLRRMQFGRKSEKLDRQIEQLELRLEDLQADQGAVVQADAKKTPHRRESASRKPLPAHLEREERVHQPIEEHCPGCGGALKALGEDVSEQLEYVRAHFRVIRHRRPNSPVRAATVSCRLQRRADRSIAACRVLLCSRTSQHRSSRTTSRS